MAQHSVWSGMKQGLGSTHGRILALGFLVGMLYFPTWLRLLVRITFTGNSATIVLNLGFLYLGLRTLWQQRRQLVAATPAFDDRVIGYCLLGGGMAWLPFCGDSVSLQALVWMMMLVGMAWSSFGADFFLRFPLPAAMILASMYPDYVFLSNRLWQAITQPYLLENFMARMGGVVLRLMGWEAVAQGRFLSMPGGAVEVLAGCSGFDMAFALAGFSLVLGLLLHQRWSAIGLTAVLGVAIALILNVPRIVLLAFAAIYWGPESFDFWHGPWGGQIFATLMFTVYYYAAMAVYDRQAS